MLLNLEPVRRRLRISCPVLRESLAELLGTMTLVFIGDSVIANNWSSVTQPVSVPLGYGAALTIAVFATGGVSGGHLNPAVTLALCMTGRCDWTRLLPFSAAQYVGGFAGAALTHGLFFDLFKHDEARKVLFPVFATYPAFSQVDGTLKNISLGGAFMDQVMGTALLLLGIMAITDRRNMNVPKGMIPVAVGLTLFTVITCSSSNTGTALNPARDLGPRLYSLAIGYTDVFKYADHFWWIPVAACYLGGTIGAGVYLFFIELHHPPEEEQVSASGDQLAPSGWAEPGGESKPASSEPQQLPKYATRYGNAAYEED